MYAFQVVRKTRSRAPASNPTYKLTDEDQQQIALLVALELRRFRTPADPDHGGPTSTATLWRDNLGGLALGMDDRDGEAVIILPLSADDADDLAAAIHQHRTTP